jgi:hypothetical protein
MIDQKERREAHSAPLLLVSKNKKLLSSISSPLLAISTFRVEVSFLSMLLCYNKYTLMRYYLQACLQKLGKE